MNVDNESGFINHIISDILKSNTEMGITQLQDILATCFQKTSEGTYEPIMVTINIPNHGVTSQIQIPMITAIPITMLSIDEADIFLNSHSFDPSQEREGDENNEYEYDTNIKCEQQPLPKGLSILIEALANTITSSPNPA